MTVQKSVIPSVKYGDVFVIAASLADVVWGRESTLSRDGMTQTLSISYARDEFIVALPKRILDESELAEVLAIYRTAHPVDVCQMEMIF